MTQLALRADVGVQTVINMMFGLAQTEPEVIAKVARALDRDVREVAGWVGQARSVRESWLPPAEADLLTDRQRKALDNLIRSMVEPAMTGMADFQYTDDEGRTHIVELKRSSDAPLRRVARSTDRSTR